MPGDEDVFAIAGYAWIGPEAAFLEFGEPLLFGGLAIFIEDENADVMAFAAIGGSEDDTKLSVGKSNQSAGLAVGDVGAGFPFDGVVGLIGDGFPSGPGPATETERAGVGVAVGESTEFAVSEDEALIKVMTVKPATASREFFSFFVEEADVAALVSHAVAKKLVVGEIEGDGFTFWIVGNACRSRTAGTTFGIHFLVVLLAKDSRVENLAAVKADTSDPVFRVFVAMAVVFAIADDVAHVVGQASCAEERSGSGDEGRSEFLSVGRALQDVNGALAGVVPGEIVFAARHRHQGERGFVAVRGEVGDGSSARDFTFGGVIGLAGGS